MTVESLTSNKANRESVIVAQVGYNKNGHMVYTKLGNGIDTTYTYDRQRKRLQGLSLTADEQAVTYNKHWYDVVDNIYGITKRNRVTIVDEAQQGEVGRNEYAHLPV